MSNRFDEWLFHKRRSGQTTTARFVIILFTVIGTLFFLAVVLTSTWIFSWIPITLFGCATVWTALEIGAWGDV